MVRMDHTHTASWENAITIKMRLPFHLVCPLASICIRVHLHSCLAKSYWAEEWASLGEKCFPAYIIVYPDCWVTLLMLTNLEWRYSFCGCSQGVKKQSWLQVEAFDLVMYMLTWTQTSNGHPWWGLLSRWCGWSARQIIQQHQPPQCLVPRTTIAQTRECCHDGAISFHNLAFPLQLFWKVWVY